MTKKDEQGIALVIEIIVIAAVLAVIGFIIWRVYDATQKTVEDSKPKQNTEAKGDDWKEVGYAIKGAYADADVVKVKDNLWRMYFATQPEVQGNNLEVYSATSSDGQTWKQEDGTRKTMATFPDVIKLSDGRWRMYFQQAGVIKSAISSDGLVFTDEPGTRIDTSNSENLTFNNVAATTTAQLDDGTYLMIYRGTINQRYAQNTPNPSTSLLMWATSTDGLAFTKKGIAQDSRNATLAGQLDGPDIVRFDDGNYRIFTTSYTGVYEFGFNGTTFSYPTLAFAGQAKKVGDNFNGAPPGDPTLAKINGIWYIYYGNTGSQSGIWYATSK